MKWPSAKTNSRVAHGGKETHFPCCCPLAGTMRSAFSILMPGDSSRTGHKQACKRGRRTEGYASTILCAVMICSCPNWPPPPPLLLLLLPCPLPLLLPPHLLVCLYTPHLNSRIIFLLSFYFNAVSHNSSLIHSFLHTFIITIIIRDRGRRRKH